MLVALPFPCNSIHPIQYPETVLWTLKDCKADKYVNVSNGNQSRPSMKRSIQDENGTPISDSLWKLIRKSVVLVAHTYLANLPTPSQAGAGQPWKKAFFKCYYPSEWDQALRKLKVQAPLLSLCFIDWKADQTLGGVLQDKLACFATAAHSAPPSCLTTPSSLGPSSCVRPSSHITAPPSSVAPSSSSAPHSSCHVSSCHLALKSSQKTAKQPAELAPTGNAKGKHRCDPSPALRTKRAKSDNDAISLVSSAGMCVMFTVVEWI
jgi:hypothetical protein